MRRIAALSVVIQAFDDDGVDLIPVSVDPLTLSWADFKAGKLDEALDVFLGPPESPPVGVPANGHAEPAPVAVT